jgi:hypothetical protein
MLYLPQVSLCEIAKFNSHRYDLTFKGEAH